MKKMLYFRKLKYIPIIFAIVTFSLISNGAIALLPSIEISWSKILDKEKHELFKKLKIKRETEIRRNYFESDSTKNSIWIRINEYDENGNQTKFQAYDSTSLNKPRFEEDYISDEMGNILEAYRNGKLIGTQEFDNQGRIIELINYDENGEASWTCKYQYDGMDNKIFETQYLYGELIDTLLNNKFEYEINNDKILVKSKECLLDTSNIFYEEKEFFVYDSLGREIQFLKFRRDKSIYFVQNSDYKTLSRIRIFYYPVGSIKQIDSMRINSEGKVIESATYKNGKLTKRRYNKYNESGKLISELNLSADEKRLLEWKYDNSGHEIEFKSYENEIVNYFKTFNYFENGLLSKKITVDTRKEGKKEIHEFRYEYHE